MADPRVQAQLTALATETAAIKHTIETQMIAVKERLKLASEALKASIAAVPNSQAMQLEGSMILMSVYAPIQQLNSLNETIKATTKDAVAGKDITTKLDAIASEFSKIYDSLGGIMKQINSKVYFGSLSDEDVARITAEVKTRSDAAAQDFVMRAMTMIMSKPTV